VWSEFYNIYETTITYVDIWSICVAVTTIAPLICAISLMLTAGIIKMLFVAMKSLLLGQIYGAAVLSGGTFFIGFLTTTVSSTTTILFFVKLLNAWSATAAHVTQHP